jgi:hypothetical protein
MAGLLLCLVFSGAGQAAETGLTDDGAIRKVVADYGRAIENKDLSLFRAVKPNLSKAEEQQLRKAFEQVHSQVTITVLSIEVQGQRATVRTARRDVLDHSVIASFPQTFLVERGPQGWAILEIAR